MNLTRYISLFTTIIISIFAFIMLKPLMDGDYVMSLDAYLYLDKFYYGFIALIIVIISVIFKRRIWIYLFAITLVLAFLNVINLHAISVSFTIGSFDFNFITVLLMLLHFSFNVDAFIFKKGLKRK